MAIWKEPTTPRRDTPLSQDPSANDEIPAATSSYDMRRPARDRATKESVIAAELTIEGKIEGSGDVRLAGRFKGDVHVDGNLTIEKGAKLTGGVRASAVVVGGELEGNIEAATRVELLETAVVAGDVKAASLTVAAGSKMRGSVEFGWDEHAQQARNSSSAA